MSKIPTVRVMRGDVPVRINARDYRHGIDKLAPGEKMPQGSVPAGAVPPPIPAKLKQQVETSGAQQIQVQNPKPAGADEDSASSATQDPPKIQTPEEIAAADKSEARAAYITAIGKPPGPKWDAAKIREEMAKRLAEAKKTEGGE
jgi:hypothetical protein